MNVGFYWAKPDEVLFYYLEKLPIYVSKRRSRVYKANFLNICSIHFVIVHHHALQADFKVIVTIFHWHPGYVLIKESRLVIAPNLEVPAIFA